MKPCSTIWSCAAFQSGSGDSPASSRAAETIARVSRACSDRDRRAQSSQPASLDGLVARMERGEFDLVAVGRALLSDPQWVEKVRAGRGDQLKDFDPAALAVLA